jgi:hypothetical protein
MISRRSLFGLALAPLAPAPTNSMFDFKDCYHFRSPQSIIAQPFPEEFATWIDGYKTMRLVKLRMIEYMNLSNAREL